MDTKPRTPGELPCGPGELPAVIAPREEELRFQDTPIGRSILAQWNQAIIDYRVELDKWWTTEYRSRTCPTCGHLKAR